MFEREYMRQDHGYLRMLFSRLRRTRCGVIRPQGQVPRMPGGQPGRAVDRLQQAAWRLYGQPRRRRSAVLLALPLVFLLMGGGVFALGRVLPDPHVPAVVKEIKTVQEVEKIVVVKEQSVPPILHKIAACESQNTHYDRRGRVLRGKENKHDVGKYQINTVVWGQVAAQQGYDLYDEQGNEQMALYLLHHYGTMPWRHSAACWVRK